MRHDSNVKPLILAACSICAGAPAVMVRDENTSKPLQRDYVFTGSVWLDAFVFCSECGAQTGEVAAAVGSYAELEQLLAKAYEAWNTRDSRNHDLYAAAVAAGRIITPPCADGWILVATEKPPYNTPVDVVCMGSVQHIAHQLINLGAGDFWMIGTDDDDYEGLTFEEVTHWRPRPVFIPAAVEDGHA